MTGSWTRSATGRCPSCDGRSPRATGPAVTGFTSLRRLPGVWLGGGKDVAQVQAHLTATDLELLSAPIEAAKVRPRIHRRYPFVELPAAIADLEQGHTRAKVAVAMT